jgi:dynein heavy chain
MYRVGSAIIDIIEAAVFLMDSTALKQVLLPSPTRCLEAFQEVLPQQASAKNRDIARRIEAATERMTAELETTQDLVEYVDYMETVEDIVVKLEEETRVTTQLYELIDRFDLTNYCKPEDMAEHESLRNEIMKLGDGVKIAMEEVPKKRDQLAESIEADVSKLGEVVHAVLTKSQDSLVFDPETKVDDAIKYTTDLDAEMEAIQVEAATLKNFQRKYKFEVSCCITSGVCLLCRRVLGSMRPSGISVPNCCAAAGDQIHCAGGGTCRGAR